MTRLRNAVRKTITQHQVKTSQHHWNKDEIEVTKLGYVIGLHSVHYSNEEAQKKMMQLIKKSNLYQSNQASKQNNATDLCCALGQCYQKYDVLVEGTDCQH